jgi:hypothetical protein
MLGRLDFHQVLDHDHHSIPIISTINVECRFRIITPDDMQGNFSICMKKSENGPLIGGVGDLMKMVDRGIGDLIKMKPARPPFSINHPHTIIVECHFRMDLMTCKRNFHLYEKIRKRSSEKASDELNDGFSSSSRSPIHHFHQTSSPDPPDQGTVFDFFHTDGKFPCMLSGSYENALNGGRRYYRGWCDGRDGSEGKSDGASFQKAMVPHFKKRWVLISKSDGSSFQKAMGPHFKKRWVLISKSDGSPFQKAMRPHLKKRWVPI